MLRERGDYDRALGLYHEALALRREVGDTIWIAWALADLGDVASAQARHAQARTWLTESHALFRQLDDASGLSLTLRELGDVARDAGDQDAARAHYEESLRISKDRGWVWGIAAAFARLGLLAQHQGDDAARVTLLANALNLIRPLDAIQAIVLILLEFADLAVTHRHAERATQLLGAVDGLLGAAHEGMAMANRDVYDRVRSAVGAQLDETRLAIMREEGRAMTLEQAVAYALEDSR